MKSCINTDLSGLIEAAQKEISTISDGSREPGTIVMFDLVGSTALKLEKGHDVAMKKMFQHNQLCRKFVNAYSGRTIKELGDGALVKFVDPEQACLCAINFVEAIAQMDFETKISIAYGKIEQLDIEGVPDVFGAVVDLCARIEKFAFPNQILIDSVTHSSVLSFLKNFDDLEISNPMKAVIKGHSDKKELFEIASVTKGLKNRLNIPFQINEEGRLLIDDKVSFIMNAQSEVIELGIRLREFTTYFTSRNTEEFKNHVIELLKTGVVLKCFALDGEWFLKNFVVSDEEKKYYQEIPETLNQLNEFKKEILEMNLKGGIEIYTYQHNPMFHAQCTDGDSSEGRMTISNYLTGIKRAQCPVIQFSKQTHPTLFKTYWKSIHEIIKNSTIWKG